ncbi:hypothetical protein VP01_3128g5 [Puccinia sorghi]|uniref:Uncharacterized protein n=1 Tax=Puccinia sorghi TaxID=27349 RepID=A0A0L6UZ43_9BASI|nr:hypothetical protein VP01_3128g5 [Puccinia sorghi]
MIHGTSLEVLQMVPCQDPASQYSSMLFVSWPDSIFIDDERNHCITISKNKEKISNKQNLIDYSWQILEWYHINVEIQNLKSSGFKYLMLTEKPSHRGGKLFPQKLSQTTKRKWVKLLQARSKLPQPSYNLPQKQIQEFNDLKYENIIAGVPKPVISASVTAQPLRIVNFNQEPKKLNYIQHLSGMLFGSSSKPGDIHLGNMTEGWTCKIFFTFTNFSFHQHLIFWIIQKYSLNLLFLATATCWMQKVKFIPHQHQKSMYHD